MFLEQSFVKGLGHASYLVADESVGLAAVVDPRRDVDEYLAVAQAEGLEIVEILETHLHNDFVSGADELRRRTGATVRIGAGPDIPRPHRALHQGDEFLLGRLRFTALATPGHTPEHVSFLVADTSRSEDPWLLFAGGALLVGSIARPDLLGGPDEARRAASVQYATLRDRIAPLPDWVELYPTHGAGSRCGAGIGSKRWSTIGFERRNNPALDQPDVESFTRFVLEGQPSVPAYWRAMRSRNQLGGRPLGELPPVRPMAPEELDHALGHGAILVDARPPEAFVAGHVPGALGVDLEPSFGTWVGSIVPIERDVVLIVPDDAALAEAVRQLRRAGFDRVVGYLAGGFDAWLAEGRPTETLKAWRSDELAAALDARTVTVVDVREASEYREGHIPGALLVPGADLPGRLGELPRGPIVAVCAGGYRSTIAASFLAGAGFEDVGTLLDGTTGFARDGRALEVEPGERRVPAGSARRAPDRAE